MLDTKDRHWISLFVLTSLLIGMYFGLMMYITTDGHLMAPLDDAFIHLQYAKNLAQGKFFSYSEGDGYSTGATSFLYPFLIAPAFLLGLSGIKILIYVYALGMICIIATAIAMYIFTRDLVDSNIAARFAVLLFLTNGNVMWGYLSGMETAVFATLIVLALCTISLWLKKQRRKHLALSIVLVSLLPLMRPEGSIIAVITFIIMGYSCYYKKISVSEFLLWIIPLCSIVFYTSLNQILLGTTVTNGMLNKSVFYDPYMSLSEKIYHVASNFTSIWTGYYSNLSFTYFKGKDPVPFFPPFVVPLFVLGSLIYVVRELRARKFGINTVGFSWYFLCISATCVLMTPVGHNMRYFQYYQPIFFIFTAIGLYHVSDVFKQKSENVMRGMGVFLILLSVPSLFYWGSEYGENCNDIFNQHRRMSWYIKDALPEDSIIGFTDAGVMAYFGERRTYDFAGLTTNGNSLDFRNGIGSSFEKVERLPADKRPDYVITYNYDYLWDEENFLGEPIYQITLEKNTIAQGEVKSVHKQDWSYLGSGDMFYLKHFKALDKKEKETQIVDKVDVADLINEQEHNYKIKYDSEKPSGYSPRNVFNFFAKRQYSKKADNKEVWDGGRATNGYEVMKVRTIAKSPLLVVMRTDAWYPMDINVYIDNQFAGKWEINSNVKEKDNSWKEPEFLIPADFVRSNTSEIKFEYIWNHSYKTTNRSFYYWFVQ